MSWGKTFIAGIALAVGALGATAAQAGVVVSSSGPSARTYPVGKQIDDNERITLREGDVLTVLDNGGTRVFRGAGTFMLARSGAASRNRAFAALTTQRSATRARTGAVRSTGSSEVSNPNLWYVNVAQSGTICLTDPAAVRLWRADTQAASTYSIDPAGADAATSVTFPAGEMLAAWDEANPPRPDTRYRIGHDTQTSPVEVQFVFLDETPEEPEALASKLIENGCITQLEQLSKAGMNN